jgi:leucine-rich repeat protein SHOC2
VARARPLPLDLNGNKLTSVPAELGRLGALTQLHLDGNQLASVPAELGGSGR